MAIEVGLVELGSVTRWLSGGTPNRAVDHYWNGDIPWISASTLKESEVSSSDQCVTKEAVALGSKMAPVNSTLLLVRGSALHNEIRAGLVVKPVCFNQDVKALIPTLNVYPKFLTYSILGRQAQLLEMVSSAGNTAGVLDTKLLQAFKIWLPDVEEQRIIASALSDVDALIAGLERLIAKKRDIKQAAMQQLLTGQTRLPGFSGEWASVQLGDLLDVCHGKNQHAVEVSDGPYPILATGGQIGTASQPLHDRPSVLIGRKGTINKPQYMDTPFWTVDTLFYCKIHHSNLAKFLYYRFLLIDWMQYNEASGVPSLNGRTIERIEIECPDAKEQTAIATVLSGMDADLAALESRLAKTLSIKQGMMQELLTGRTRLI